MLLVLVPWEVKVRDFKFDANLCHTMKPVSNKQI